MDRSSIKEYYARVTAVDIGKVARDLIGDRLTSERDGELRFDCPHHESRSKASFIVDLGKQAFFCKGCGVGGDVLQMVEFVQSGQVTSHCKGAMTDSHRKARDYLASVAGMPPLSEHGLSPDELQKIESKRQEEESVFAVLGDVAQRYHEKLIARADVLKWFTGQYAISRETIERLKIGFADNDGLLDDYLRKQKGHSWKAITKSGCVTLSKRDGEPYPFFRNRIVFPYWKQGRCVYMIGRRTQWTPDSKYELPKYKKLPTHSPSRSYISPVVQNNVFYNEDCLVAERDEVVITEGVTDCIALMERGIATVSPVTVCFRDKDHAKLLSLVRHVKKVFICQDNEISGVGLTGALKTARFLSRNKVAVRLVELPLPEKQQMARRALAEHGILPDIDPKEIDSVKGKLSEDEREKVDNLLDDAKIDLNEYLLNACVNDFRKLMDDAPRHFEWQIKRLDPKPTSSLQRNEDLKPVLETLAELDPLDQAAGINLLQKHYGRKDLPKKLLEDSIKQCAQDRARENEDDETVILAPPDSCEAAIEIMIHKTAKEEKVVNWSRVADAAFDWFEAHGASFFRNRAGRVFVCFDDTIYEMAPNPNTNRSYLAMMHKHAGMNCMTPTGRIFFESLANVAFNRGRLKESFTWSHTDRNASAIYFNLYNDRNEIVKITPDGVELLKNGNNPDDVMLIGSQKMLPIRFIPDVDLKEAERLVANLICDNLTCDDNERLLIVHWLSAFLLMDFAGTKPMLRFEGPKESGKSVAGKLISTLIYGKPQQKRATTAANYADAAVHPLVILDNIETKNASDSLIDFLLTSVTGIGNEKRKRGTDSETVTEFAKCLINSSGIEPLAGDLSEVISRTFIVEFDINKSRHRCFDEVGAVDALSAARDCILSALFIRTHKTLRLMRDHGKKRVMALIGDTLGPHSKRRANDYLALMYLMMIADGDEAQVERDMQQLDPAFIQMMATQQESATSVQVGSNPIVTLLKGLFREYAMAVQTDTKNYGQLGLSQVDKFTMAYHLELEDEHTVADVKASDLHTALALFAKNKGLTYPYRSPKQLGRRLNNDVDTLAMAGIRVTSTPGHARQVSYRIELEGDA